jgi:hypothetical protein
MKWLFCAAAPAAFAAVISQPPAFARDTGSSAVASQVAADGAAGVLSRAPHYDWQYHYVGSHGRFVGHWVLAR